MQFFLDSANFDEIKEINDLGIIDGVTTNPTLIANNKEDFSTIVKNICAVIDGPISVEVNANNYTSMIEEGNIIANLGKNIVIKLPITWDGIRACKYFTQKNIKTNLTLCFSANQALIAAKAGASYISPFIGRLDDIGQEGISLINDIKVIFENYPEFNTKILAASIRSPNHVLQCAIIGADVITMPAKIIRQLLTHPLTDSGLEIFNKDWAKSGMKII